MVPSTNGRASPGSPAQRSTATAAITVGNSGPGVHQRPSSSRTTASSATP